MVPMSELDLGDEIGADLERDLDARMETVPRVFPLELPRSPRSDLARRAREIGGDLSIDVLAAGTQVSVRLVDGAWSAMYPDPQSVQDGSMGDRSGANPV